MYRTMKNNKLLGDEMLEKRNKKLIDQGVDMEDN